MHTLKDYLAKFKNLTPPDDFVREKIQVVLQKNLGVKVSFKDIQMSEKKVVVKQNSALKNAIFLKKQVLLKELRDELGEEKAPNDIG